jgi:hypothetical protein
MEPQVNLTDTTNCWDSRLDCNINTERTYQTKPAIVIKSVEVIT